MNRNLDGDTTHQLSRVSSQKEQGDSWSGKSVNVDRNTHGERVYQLSIGKARV